MAPPKPPVVHDLPTCPPVRFEKTTAPPPLPPPPPPPPPHNLFPPWAIPAATAAAAAAAVAAGAPRMLSYTDHPSGARRPRLTFMASLCARSSAETGGRPGPLGLPGPRCAAQAREFACWCFFCGVRVLAVCTPASAQCACTSVNSCMRTRACTDGCAFGCTTVVSSDQPPHLGVRGSERPASQHGPRRTCGGGDRGRRVGRHAWLLLLLVWWCCC